MRDLIYLLVLFGFFAVAVGVLRLCEAIIGPDEITPVGADVTAPTELVDAP